MSDERLEELGPIDYMVLEWQGEQPDAGEVQPLVAAAFAEFEGASSGLLGYEDLQEAAAALDPGTSAAVLVWENRWAAPVAAALRRSGGQLVASGRLPIQAIIAALDAVEASN